MNRMTQMVVVLAAIGAAGAFAGCGTPETQLSCPSNGAGVVGEATSAVISGDNGPVLRVQGSAEHKDGLAITHVRVGDFEAVADEGAFNFSKWTVEIPTALLGSAGSTVKLDVTATDACEKTYPFAAVETTLAPPRAVTSLEVAILYPGEESYLPSTLTIPAQLKISAGGDAVGVPVEVAAEGANFVGGDEGTVTMTLAQPPGAASTETPNAVATAWLTSDQPGDVLVTATALGHVAKKTLKVAGPPTIFPGSGDLFAGNEVNIKVLSDGRLVQCDVVAPPDVTVQLGSDVVSGPVPLELMRGQDVTFQVLVDPAITEAGTLSLLCRDAYGQAVEATFNVTP